MSQHIESSTYRRAGIALCLVAAAVASALWSALAPRFPAGYDERLAVIDQAGASATASAFLFAVAQLPMLVAVLGIAGLARERAPVLAETGGILAVIGVFGHMVFGGVSLVTLTMAADAGNRATYAGLVEQVESSPVMVFAAAGLLGTVLGFLVLGAALWRSRAVPRWVPGLLWAFVALEFVGSGLSEYATHAAAVSFLIVFGALALRVWQGPQRETTVVPATSLA